ncbi:FkbM family methyltransferase [Ruegeria sp. 1NDH52C]|uniref:FkbM family methyltransferase n=1 Tax=Ruegeria alba TaxID=2916756 RepID=A0ABS9NRB6_9RHOB|nr:FkbM family methyltransferase [Ruegeria alba]
MSHSISNTTLVRRDRLRQLQQREKAWFDLEFLKAMAPEDRSRCIDLLDQSKSQLRQDLFALCQTGFKEGGFFVEFGATDGIELNNSYLLETGFGWSGILAEPARGWHAALKANRTATIETRCVWHTSGETLGFTEAPRGENSGISTFVKSSRRIRGQNYKVETISLIELLETHKAPAHIDYISIDTEGSEFDILNAFDFDRWTFGVMTVEHNHAPQREDIHTLLTSKGYRRVLPDISRFDDWYLREG